MKALASILVALAAATAPAFAEQPGTASGEGVIDRMIPTASPNDEPQIERVVFQPRHGFAYRQTTPRGHSDWLVLTEKEPPIADWLAAADPAEARRTWCEREKASFVAVEVNRDGEAELYALCPANGNVNVEMISVWNGLPSVALEFEQRDDTRWRGTMRGGEGSCGETEYCEQTEDFTFDVPFVH